MEHHLITKDVKKYEILKQVITKHLKGTETALLLEYHPVHISSPEEESYNLRNKRHPAS